MPFKRFVNRLLRYLRPYSPVIPKWPSNFNNHNLHINSNHRLKVIIATSTGSNWTCSSFEGLLGLALSFRGADVSFLLCDGVLPACQECDIQWLSENSFAKNGPKSLCSTCFNPAFSMLKKTGLPVIRYSHYLNEEEILKNQKVFNEDAKAGTLRFYGRGILQNNNNVRKIYNRYHHASNITSNVIARLIADQKPDIAVFHHGIYVPQGVIGKEFRKAGIRVVNWTPSYRRGTVLFSHNNSYHFTMIDESVEEWININWTKKNEDELMHYLKSRRKGNNDWINFQVNPIFDRKLIADKLNLNDVTPVVGLLTNVMWDAQLHFEKTAFTNMLDWLFCTIDHFINRNDIQLVIRIHPAEIYGTVPSRQLVADEIRSKYGSLPEHIKIVSPDSPISTYALMEMCDSVLTYATKTTLELACFGIPVIVTGEAWCRNKGFTIDAYSPTEYENILKTLPLKYKLSNRQILNAKKYAYHLFFRRMIPVSLLQPLKYFGLFKINLNSINDIQPGIDRGLDLICDGILFGKKFVYQP